MQPPICRRRLLFEHLIDRIVLAATVYDFSVDDGGFTSSGRFGAPPWAYTGTQWESRQGPFGESNFSYLFSPVVQAEATTVEFTMDHSYQWFVDVGPPTNFIDGGILQLSVNGGDFEVIDIERGYDEDNIGDHVNTVGAIPGFGGDSGGLITDRSVVETAVGDELQFRLWAGWAGVVTRDPNWTVTQVTIDTGGGASDAAVVGRHVFYNDSFFDVDDAPATAASATDDQAIATDKTALLPGETATFANYTSYSLGINGIMVDVADLAGEPTAETVGDFFEFSVGNDDTPDDWEAAAAPIDVSVRAGEGVDGSDRVTILWEANAIQNGWLQTTVLANDNTGLGEPDVFYFGNAIGDSGNSAADASVNAQDIGGARDNPHNFLNRALIDDAFDYNRDSLVNAQDIGIARDNPTNFLSDLNLVTVPAAAPVAAAATAFAPVSSNINEEGLPVPLQNLASRDWVNSDSSEHVFNQAPLLDQPRIDHANWWLDKSGRNNSSSEQSDPLNWSDLLLEGDLIDLLAQNSQSADE